MVQMQRMVPARAGPGGGRRLRALVIDDSTFDQRLVTRLCAGLGIEVACARSAEEALERLATQGCDLLFVDHALGAATGFDVLETIERHPAAPGCRILLTGNDDPRIAREAAERGLDACLSKAGLTAERLATALALRTEPTP